MNQKMIEQHKKELETSIRLYQIGVMRAIEVKNKLNCLYADILLAQKKTVEQSDFDFRLDRSFETLIRELIE